MQAAAGHYIRGFIAPESGLLLHNQATRAEPARHQRYQINKSHDSDDK